jgi:Family of unknown function (DUF6188)
MEVAEYELRWAVEVSGAVIVRACFDWSVTLIIGEPPQAGLEVRIEQPFVLAEPDGRERLLVPEGDPGGLAPVLRIVRQDVVRVDAFKDGHLEIGVADGTVLSVPSAEDFESWEISGLHGLRIVSVAGGRLSVWQPQG